MCEVLKLSRVSADDSFFDLGGESISAAEFIGTIQDRFHWTVTLPQMYRNPTVTDLASLLDSMPQDAVIPSEDPLRSIVRFNEDGSRPPLIFLHGSAIAEALCAELAERFGPSQPIFLMPIVGAAGEPIPPTIQQLAASTLESVRSLRPHARMRSPGSAARRRWRSSSRSSSSTMGNQSDICS